LDNKELAPGCTREEATGVRSPRNELAPLSITLLLKKYMRTTLSFHHSGAGDIASFAKNASPESGGIQTYALKNALPIILSSRFCSKRCCLSPGGVILSAAAQQQQ